MDSERNLINTRQAIATFNGLHRRDVKKPNTQEAFVLEAADVPVELKFSCREVNIYN